MLGQHPKLFERPERQVFGLVDDQQDTLVVTVDAPGRKSADQLQNGPLGEPSLAIPEPACRRDGKKIRFRRAASSRSLPVTNVLWSIVGQQIVDEDVLAAPTFP